MDEAESLLCVINHCALNTHRGCEIVQCLHHRPGGSLDRGCQKAWRRLDSPQSDSAGLFPRQEREFIHLCDTAGDNLPIPGTLLFFFPIEPSAAGEK